MAFQGKLFSLYSLSFRRQLRHDTFIETAKRRKRYIFQGMVLGTAYCFHATATPSRSGMMVVMKSGAA